MTEPTVVRTVSLPAHYYLGAHGDPVAVFDYLHLDFMSDGTVRWREDHGDAVRGEATDTEEAGT